MDRDNVSNEDFYKKEAEYWQDETERLLDIFDQIIYIAKSRRDGKVPPEPPIGTKFFLGTEAVWESTTAGWSCSDKTCRHCPTDWQEVYTFGLDKKATRVLPN